jgi:hypothetical protein
MSALKQARVSQADRQITPVYCDRAYWRSLLLRLSYSVLALALASSLSACGNFRRPKVDEEVRKVRMAKQVVLEDKVQEFGNKAHKFKMLPPRAFLYSEIETPRGQVFSFSTPLRKDGRAGVFSVSCVANQPGHEHRTPGEVVSSVLAPLAQGCTEFHAGKNESFDEKGRTFDGVQFSGSYGGYYPITGYVYVTPVQDGFYIVQWLDGEVNFSRTKDVMLNSFKSLEIEY